MKIVEPYARMLSPTTGNANTIVEADAEFTRSHGIAMLRRVEYYARVSHASEDARTAHSWDKFLRSVVLQHGDWSVTEHEKVTCEFLVDRGITHEIVRHRIGSYTQESTRFVNYKKKGGEAKFIAPQEFTCATTEDELFHSHWATAIEQCEKSYMDMLDMGVKPQIARSVFPNALASKIIVTYNLRSWRHFFIMRTSAQAHPQMRQVCDPLLKAFQETIPILYEDIEPGQQQSEAMRKAR
jgi:thymidylate synthase (FAD)